MSKPPSDDEDDAPLDPAMERVQAKLRRLLLVSGATMAIGVLAVLVAVVIRLSREDGSPSGAPFASTIELPAGAAVVATDLDGERIAVTTDGPEGRVVHVFDLASGRRIGSATLVAR